MLYDYKNAILQKLRREHRLWKFDLMALNEKLAQGENLVLTDES